MDYKSEKIIQEYARNFARLGGASIFALFFAMCVCVSSAQNQTSVTTPALTSAYAKQAQSGVVTLQSWYVASTGLYKKPTDWWNAANAMTVLADYSRATHSTQYLSVISNTFDHANQAYGITNFINDSNDDEGWWAMAWIDAYDLTHQHEYLAMAQTIFADLTTQWEMKTCGGGVWWSKDLKHSAYKNAITNELFLEIAASLANRASDPGQRAPYLAWAHKEWKWFQGSGMINADHMVNDGLNATNPAACTSNNQTTWTYNQGVILGGLAELDGAEHDPALLRTAQSIAEATMTHLVTAHGVLNEPRVNGADAPQFKGVFLRNLARLYVAAPNPKYESFAQTNADSILHNDQGPRHQFGALWQGPFDSGDGTRQTSALDALIAAMEMQ
jgi:predicted alpha-1,6-mannanase (GH76 family)